MGNTKVNKYLPRGNSSQWYKLEKINRRKTTVFDIYDIYTIKLINQIGVLVTEVLVLFGYSRELPNQLLGFQIPTKMQIKQLQICKDTKHVILLETINAYKQNLSTN